ncbi:hypothetical protein BKA70DRAFT_1443453 [Coprinopsis sp. MPI-PUGE-AT-0042]|nr:hypothetical protein BKA70DRAFT_1443453 [Coprinopsis sp. MPI-PUGE-AT-0042]
MALSSLSRPYPGVLCGSWRDESPSFVMHNGLASSNLDMPREAAQNLHTALHLRHPDEDIPDFLVLDPGPAPAPGPSKPKTEYVSPFYSNINAPAPSLMIARNYTASLDVLHDFLGTDTTTEEVNTRFEQSFPVITSAAVPLAMREDLQTKIRILDSHSIGVEYRSKLIWMVMSCDENPVAILNYGRYESGYLYIPLKLL